MRSPVLFRNANTALKRGRKSSPSLRGPIFDWTGVAPAWGEVAHAARRRGSEVLLHGLTDKFVITVQERQMKSCQNPAQGE